MSPATPLVPAFRLGLTYLSRQCAKLSTTAGASAGLKSIDNSASQPAPDPQQPPRAPSVDHLRQILLRNAEKNARAAYNPRGPNTEQEQGSGWKTAYNDMVRSESSEKYLRQAHRKWQVGDVYAPRDLHPSEQKKWRKKTTPPYDVIDMLGINPLDNYKNFAFLSEFMTPYGRIKHSSLTGLRPVNQRKVAKAIRRAVGLGIHPSVHYHPEMLCRQTKDIPLYISKKSESTKSDLDEPKKKRKPQH